MYCSGQQIHLIQFLVFLMRKPDTSLRHCQKFR